MHCIYDASKNSFCCGFFVKEKGPERKGFKVHLLNINCLFGGIVMKQKQEKQGIISLFVKSIMTNIISLAEIVFKPYYLLPIIGVIIISTVLMALFGGILERPVTDLVLYFDEIPQDNLLGILLFSYPIEILEMLILSLFMSIVSLIGMISVSRMAKGEGLVNSVNQSISEWRKALGVVVIVWVVAIIFFAVASLITSVEAINGLIMIILYLALFVIASALLIKAIFVLPALTEEKETKKAIALGFDFTNRVGIIKFLSIIVFLGLAIAIALIGWILIYQVGIILGVAFEFPAMVIGEAFGTAFFVTAITNYFYSKEKK